jgi:hypothetical protein
MNQLNENLELGCFRDSEGIALDNWQIAIPDTTMHYKLVKWYDPPLTHVGMTRLKHTIGTHFCQPKLQAPIRYIVGICDPCHK